MCQDISAVVAGPLMLATPRHELTVGLTTSLDMSLAVQRSVGASFMLKRAVDTPHPHSGKATLPSPPREQPCVQR